MTELLRDMFWAPEAQNDPYAWAAVLLAHAASDGLDFVPARFQGPDP